MIRFTLLLALSLTAGCSTVGNSRQQEDGSFIISVYSNAFSSPKKIKAKFEQEAKESCGGGDFHFVGRLGSEVKNIKTYGTAYNTSTNVLQNERVVRCGPGPKKVVYYTHAQFGEVELPDDRFTQSIQACDTKIAEDGVMIDGVKTTDPEAIKRYRVKYLVWTVMNVKEADLARADQLAPEKFQEAIRVAEASKTCLAEAGWPQDQRKTKTIYPNNYAYPKDS